jgi:hypothetical protein
MPTEYLLQAVFNIRLLSLNQHGRKSDQSVRYGRITGTGVMAKFLQSACFVFMASAVVASTIATLVL